MRPARPLALLLGALAAAAALAAGAAAQTGTLAGRITDAATGDPLPGATVQAGALGRAADLDGAFRLELPAGAHTVTVRSVGYETGAYAVTVRAGATTALEAALAPTQLETVVVDARRAETLTKTDAPLGLVPQSVAVVPARVLRAQDVRATGDALANVSSASAVRREGPDSRVTLRGFEAEPTGGGVRRNGIEFASVYDRLGANVARVEVLKGPSSVLYGRLEPGGVVNLVTLQPERDARRRLSLATGWPGRLAASVDATGPLSGTLAGRVVAAAEREGSARDGVALTDLLVAPSAAWRRGATDVTVEAEARVASAVLDPGLAAPGTAAADADGAPLGRFYGEADGRLDYRAGGVFGVSETRLPRGRALRLSLSAARYVRDRDAIRLDSLSANSETVQRGLQTDRLDLTYLTAEALVRAPLRTGPVRHRATLGAEVTRIGADVSAEGPVRQAADGRLLAGPIAPVSLPDPQPTGLPTDALDYVSADVLGLNAGVFVQDRATVPLGAGRALHLVGSVRAAYVLAAADWIAISATPEVPAGVSSREVAFTPVTPALAALAEVAPGVAVYASTGSSYNPVIEAVAEDGSPFEPTRGRQVEGGVKLDAFAGRLAATLAAFHIRKRNAVTQPPGGFYVQTGLQRSRGVEADVLAEPLRGLTVVASGAWQDAEVLEDSLYAPGTPLPNTPAWSGRAWAELARAGWAVRGGARYAGARISDLDDQLELRPAVHVEAGASVRVGLAELRADVRAVASGRRYAAAISRSGRPLVVVWPEPPLTARLGLRVDL